MSVDRATRSNACVEAKSNAFVTMDDRLHTDEAVVASLETLGSFDLCSVADDRIATDPKFLDADEDKMTNVDIIPQLDAISMNVREDWEPNVSSNSVAHAPIEKSRHPGRKEKGNGGH